MNKDGLLLIISGFSGTGKGTVVKRIMEKYSDQYALSISSTTRAPREGETDGIDYFFKTKEEFEEMIGNNEFIEYANYVGNYYGTTVEYVNKCFKKGKNVILEIEIQGALNVKKLYPDAVLVFLLPPGIEELEERLINRGTETEDVIKSRLKRGAQEVEYAYMYDFIVINDDLEECVDSIVNIVKAEKLSLKHQKSFIDKIDKDFKSYEI